VEFVARRLADAARSRAELRAHVAEDEALQLQRRTGVFGTLDALGLAGLLTIIDQERRSGTIILTREHDGGRLTCLEGRVLSAHLEGVAFGPRGAAAVYRMLTWTFGRFHFTPSTGQALQGVKDEIGEPTMHLLMEGARLVDEATAATEMGPAPR
jgi:hypothetical protein